MIEPFRFRANQQHELRMLPLRSIAMLAALLSVLSAAHAQAPLEPVEPHETVTYFGLTFPPEIDGARRISVRAYERSDPGGGYSAGYRHGEATSTVYIYDDRVPSIPDNLSSIVVQGHFERVKASVGRVPSQEGVSVKEKNAFTIADKGKRRRLLCQAYAMTRQTDSRAFETFVCLGVLKGKFFKVRTTMPPTADAEAEVRRFAGSWVDRLWSPSAAAR